MGKSEKGTKGSGRGGKKMLIINLLCYHLVSTGIVKNHSAEKRGLKRRCPYACIRSLAMYLLVYDEFGFKKE